MESGSVLLMYRHTYASSTSTALCAAVGAHLSLSAQEVTWQERQRRAPPPLTLHPQGFLLPFPTRVP